MQLNPSVLRRLLSPPVLALIFVLMAVPMTAAIVLGAPAAPPAASKPPASAAPAAKRTAATSAGRAAASPAPHASARDSGTPQGAGMWSALAAGAGLLVVLASAGGFVLRRRRAAATRQSARRPMALPQYNPSKVGNDASARPWESGFAPHEEVAAEDIGGSARASLGRGIPPDFDVAGFTAAAGRSFIALQAAWDKSDLPTLRALMTDEMLAETSERLAERGRRRRAGPPCETEVAMLDAQLLGVEQLPELYVASVEFSGMLREDPSSGLRPFRVVWNMTRPRHGQGDWLVAGMQAMQ